MVSLRNGRKRQKKVSQRVINDEEEDFDPKSLSYLFTMRTILRMVANSTAMSRCTPIAPLALRRRLHLEKISAPLSAKMNALSRTRGPTGPANKGRGAGERGTGRRADERTPSPSNAEPTGRGTAPVGAEDDGSGDAARPDGDGPIGGGAGRDETPGGGRGVADARTGSHRPRGSSFRRRREPRTRPRRRGPFPHRDGRATAGPGSCETNNGTRVRVRIDGGTAERDCDKRPRGGGLSFASTASRRFSVTGESSPAYGPRGRD